MLVLRSSPASPFGRKVKIAASILGLSGRIEVQLADTTDPADSLRSQNPLGKIPTLLLEDGSTLYDSRVIVEYLDMIAGGGIVLPAAIGPRIRALKLQALADGVMDAALLQVYEIRFREEAQRSAAWTANQAGKVERGLAHLESIVATLDQPTSIGEIAVACALGYLDLRFAGAWRTGHPGLVRWLDGFAGRTPAFEATRAKG